jgi:hypothetical protein
MMTDQAEPTVEAQVTPPLVDVSAPAGSSPPSPTPTGAGGISERPDWLPEKFKAPEDLVTSYKELESKFSERVNIPETYEVEVPAGLEIPDTYYSAFKDAGLTNDQTQAMLNFYASTVAPEFVSVSRELELTKLSQSLDTDVAGATEEAKKILEWANSSPNGESLVSLHGSTASGVMYLKAHMEKQLSDSRMDDLSGGTPAAYSDSMSAQEIDSMVQNPRYMTDPAYKAEVQRKMAKQMEKEAQAALDRMQ